MQYNITYRKKDGGWQYIISYKDNDGKWKQKSKQGFPLTRIGKQTATDEALTMVGELKKQLTIIIPKELVGISFKEFGERYLEHSKLYSSLKTIQSTQTVLNKFSGLNDKELSKITSLDIQKIVDTFVKKGLNSNTILYYLKKLRIIFNNAKYQYQIISNNPVCNINVNKPKEPDKKALTDQEVQSLLACFKDTIYYLLLFIAVNTGMRIGEILGLKWSDIDDKNYTIQVERQWKRSKEGKNDFGELKSSNSYRTIPISKKTCGEIFKHKNVIPVNNRIFMFNSKETVISDVNFELKSHGFDISFHELRHTYATKLIANGMDFKTAAKILGHNVQQTIRTYSHVNNDMMNNAKSLIENIF